MLCTALRVAQIDPHTDPRWETFVNAHPDASVYHHPAWLMALEQESGQKGLYLSCEDEHGQLQGILPLMYTRGLPFRSGDPLMGRRLASLPRTPIAGPLALHDAAATVLLESAVQEVRNKSSRDAGFQLQIKTARLNLDGMVDGLHGTPWRLSYILRLPDSAEGPFRIADANHRSSVKRAVNKAAKLGVRVRPAESEAELRQWYRLYLDAMRRNVVPPRSYRFFAALWKFFVPRGMLQLLLAEQEVEGRKNIVAGSLFLMHGDTVSYAFGGSSTAGLPLRPNDAIQWHAIGEACRRGFRFFDFGEVPESDQDLAKFKMKWGAEPVRLYRYYYPAPTPESLPGEIPASSSSGDVAPSGRVTPGGTPGGTPGVIPGVTHGVTPGTRSRVAVSSGDVPGDSIAPDPSSRWLQQFGEAVWHRLPLILTAWLGEKIFDYL